MAQQPSFDMSKLTSADKVLLGASLLLVIDSFLPWQRACASFGGLGICVSRSAWGGNAAFLGILMGIFAIVLLLYVGAGAMGMTASLGPQASMIGNVLVGGTVVFGVLKFLFSAFDHGYIFAWLGLILLLVVAYGGYMKMQEPKASPAAPPAAGGATT